MKKALFSVVALIIPAILTISAVCMVDVTWFTVVGIVGFAIMALQTYIRMTKTNLKTCYQFAFALRWNGSMTFLLCALATPPYNQIFGSNNSWEFWIMGAIYYILALSVASIIFPDMEKLLEKYSDKEVKDEKE